LKITNYTKVSPLFSWPLRFVSTALAFLAEPHVSEKTKQGKTHPKMIIIFILSPNTKRSILSLWFEGSKNQIDAYERILLFPATHTIDELRINVHWNLHEILTPSKKKGST
jgi:hypothetical protein